MTLGIPVQIEGASVLHNSVDLTCPVCNYEYIHHGKIRVWDGGETAVTRIDIGKGVIRNTNPSSRRHGLRIAFECEGCGDEKSPHNMELCIAQHKGNTQMWWEVYDKRKKST